MMNPERILEMRNNPNAPYYVIYEDAEALVVYKKRDVLSVATLDKKTYTHNLLAYLGHYAKEAREQVYLVHRLDVETSGLMIFAKSKEMQEKIKACFEARTVQRFYEAVIKEALPIGKTYDVKQYLAEEGMHVVVSDAEHGKEALTHIEVANPIQIGTALKIQIETGRKNQIRLALHSLGFTLLGDKRYSGNDAKRMYLNAYRLVFPKESGLKILDFASDPLWLTVPQKA
ncbi:MAG: RNA pseudouridine synthase [Bacilli bacterium]